MLIKDGNMFSNYFFYIYIYCFSQIRNIPPEDKPDLYYWAEITEQHTQTLKIQQIPNPLMVTGHVINCSSCENI